jgi:uncharacterized membrane protein YeaQ/YmgE (transglycosylase-associated protein family)
MPPTPQAQQIAYTGEGRNGETNHLFCSTGLIAGWLVGRVGSHRIIGDIIIGLIGSFLGGSIFSLFVDGDTGFWGSIPMSLLGTCILVAIFHAVTPRRRLRPRNPGANHSSDRFHHFFTAI